MGLLNILLYIDKSSEYNKTSYLNSTKVEYII